MSTKSQNQTGVNTRAARQPLVTAETARVDTSDRTARVVAHTGGRVYVEYDSYQEGRVVSVYCGRFGVGGTREAVEAAKEMQRQDQKQHAQEGDD